MNLDCSCGHQPDEHQDATGRCEGQCVDSDYGTYNCLCSYYTREKL